MFRIEFTHPSKIGTDEVDKRIFRIIVPGEPGSRFFEILFSFRRQDLAETAVFRLPDLIELADVAAVDMLEFTLKASHRQR